jgi:hypothetical protein
MARGTHVHTYSHKQMDTSVRVRMPEHSETGRRGGPQAGIHLVSPRHHRVPVAGYLEAAAVLLHSYDGNVGVQLLWQDICTLHFVCGSRTGNNSGPSMLARKLGVAAPGAIFDASGRCGAGICTDSERAA